MAEFIILNVDGAEALNRALQTLPDKVQKKVIVSAVTKAATPLTRAVRQATPIGPTKNLRKSVKKIVRRRTKKGPMALVGHTYPSGAHAHLVERGTKPRYTRAGKFTGVMPANPYMIPAFRSVASTVERQLRTLIIEGVEKEATKLAGKVNAG